MSHRQPLKKLSTKNFEKNSRYLKNRSVLFVVEISPFESNITNTHAFSRFEKWNGAELLKNYKLPFKFMLTLNNYKAVRFLQNSN